ncbi:SERTA domain-containing protein 3 isoform X2 [Eulemur rufifrons]|uniref:SERTA domain-containing protein 3 isoform X2 n=1 Tax=Eulemur rufifrons TaxID=859984 RepID=UPI0037421A7C
MVGGLKRKHSDVEGEEEDEKRDWSPAGLQSYQQALLRISLDKVQRSLGPRAPSLRRHVLIHNTLQQLQAALRLAPAPALPPEPLFLGEEDFSLSATIGSILRELETSMDETEPPQNPVAPPGLQNELPPQPDPVFLEALSSRVPQTVLHVCVCLVTPAFCEVLTPLVTTGASGKIKKARPVKG